MELSKGMIDYYLEKITGHWFDTNEVPADDLNKYYEKAIYIKEIALEKGDLEYLKIGLDYFLCHKEVDLENHGYSYSWTDKEVREIIRYIVSVIYPNHITKCEELKDYQMINTNINEWWESKKIMSKLK